MEDHDYALCCFCIGVYAMGRLADFPQINSTANTDKTFWTEETMEGMLPTRPLEVRLYLDVKHLTEGKTILLSHLQRHDKGVALSP
jgi:hypothetical protein